MKKTKFNSVEFENNHLKGQLEAIKHYYAVLIAKNVTKVEEVIEKLNEEIKWLDDGIKTYSEKIIELNQKIKEVRKIKRTSLEEKIELLENPLNILKKERQNYYELVNTLRQVL